MHTLSLYEQSPIMCAPANSLRVGTVGLTSVA